MKTLITLAALFIYSSFLGQEFATGYTPMPKKEYDNLKIAFCASMTDRELPVSYVISEDYFPTPGSQGSLGSCVGWSTGYALASFYFSAKYKWGKPTTTSQIMSPAFVYHQIRKCNCAPNCGSYIGDALNLMKNYGVVSWENMPYNTQVCDRPNANHFTQASSNRISGWNRLIDKLNFNEYKEHLSNDVPVVIGAPLGAQFGNYGYKKSANPFTCTQVTSGGHAMLVVGYDDNKRAFKIMNSWGKDWGVNGYIWVDYDCFKLMMSNNSEAYVINKDYELNADKTPDENPATLITAANFKPYGHWEQIREGHYYIDYGLKIDPSVAHKVTSVTYVFDHPSFTNKYISSNKAPYYQTSYEGPYCLSNLQAIVYLTDGTTVKLNIDGCKILEKTELKEDDWSTLEIHPIVTAVPKADQKGYYKFEIGLRGVENVKGRITKAVYDFNHPSFKNRYITVTNKNNSFGTSYNGWGCLNNLRVTIYFDNGVQKTYSINMCKLLGW